MLEPSKKTLDMKRLISLAQELEPDLPGHSRTDEFIKLESACRDRGLGDSGQKPRADLAPSLTRRGTLTP
jgi:hypothetical protein